MRKIIVTEFITLDGVVEAPGGNEAAHPHGGWTSTRWMNLPVWMHCCWAKHV
jgi:hypothetical protein